MIDVPDEIIDVLRNLVASAGNTAPYESIHFQSNIETPFDDGDGSFPVTWISPQPHDIFYLANADNVLEFGGKSRDESVEKLQDFISDTGDMAFMRKPVGGGSSENNIKVMKFEIYDDGSDPVGMLMIPFGHPGTMLNVILVTQTMVVLGVYNAIQKKVGGGVVSPMPENLEGEIGGLSLVTQSYVMGNGVTFNPDNTGNIGGPDHPHVWLQYMLPGSSTFIVPGEFVGIACQPALCHCWYEQETSPFVYSGHWMETRFYTSGKVKTVMGGGLYVVTVKNEDVEVVSTDYYEYAVGDRVGILKVSNGTGAYLFNEMGSRGGSDWRIIPVDFYGATP